MVENLSLEFGMNIQKNMYWPIVILCDHLICYKVTLGYLSQADSVSSRLESPVWLQKARLCVESKKVATYTPWN